MGHFVSFYYFVNFISCTMAIILLINMYLIKHDLINMYWEKRINSVLIIIIKYIHSKKWMNN